MKRTTVFGWLSLGVLFLLIGASLLPSGVAAQTGTVLAFVLPAVLVRWRCPRLAPLPWKSSRGSAAFLLLLPSFILLTGSVSILSDLLYRALGLAVPAAAPFDSVTLSFLFQVVLAAVAEEMLCRGVGFSLLLPCGEREAVLTTALTFALLHANFYQMPYAFLAGLFLGCLRLYTGSWLYPVLFHLANNAAALVSADWTVGCFFLVFGVPAAVGIPIFFFLCRRKAASSDAPLCRVPAAGAPGFVRGLAASPYPFFVVILLLLAAF